MVPKLKDLCWIWHDGRPMKCRVFHVTKCFYCGSNADGFINSSGELISPGECISLPPGYRHATFAPFIEGEPAPVFIRSKAGYFIPAATPHKPTPLF